MPAQRSALSPDQQRPAVAHRVAVTGALLFSALLSPALSASTVRGLRDVVAKPTVESGICPTFPAAPPVAGNAMPMSAEVKGQLAALEKQLASMPRDSPQYAVLNGVLTDLKSQLKVGAPPSAAAGKPVEYKKISTQQALVNLYTNLADHVSPRAWKELTTDKDLSDPTRASKIAVSAVLNRRPMLAVAAYLRVLEAHPKDRDALFNLASLSASLGAPNEALALLDASVAAGGPRSTFYPAEAQVLTVRGFALLLVNRSKDAEVVLTRAVKIAPRLLEAQRNLAAALANQGKCSASRAAVARSRSRHDIPKKSADTPATAGEVKTSLPVQVPTPAADVDQSERSLRDLLDFRRGRTGRWPYWPTNYNPYDEAQLERRATELSAMRDRLAQAIKTDGQLGMSAPSRLQQLFRSVASQPMTEARVRMLYAGQFQIFKEKKFTGMLTSLAQDLDTYRKTYADARQHLGQQLLDARSEYDQRYKACPSGTGLDYCRKKAEYDFKLQACLNVVNWNDQWKGSASFLLQSTKPLVTEFDLFYSTVISYASLPLLQDELRRNHRMFRNGLLSIVPGYLALHLAELDRLNEPCEYVARTNPPRPQPDDPAASLPEFSPAGCSPVGTATVKVVLVQFGMNCEKVSAEVSKEIPWLDIGLFVSVEKKASAGSTSPPTARDKFIKALGAGQVKPAKLPEFGKQKGEVSIFTVTAGVSAGESVAGNGVTAKDGLYLSFDSDGNLVDVGVKGETSQSVGAEVDLGFGEVGVGMEFDGVSGNISFLPSAPGA